jgi:hypothetical protein
LYPEWDLNALGKEATEMQWIILSPQREPSLNISVYNSQETTKYLVDVYETPYENHFTDDHSDVIWV